MLKKKIIYILKTKIFKKNYIYVLKNFVFKYFYVKYKNIFSKGLKKIFLQFLKKTKKFKFKILILFHLFYQQ
jgi:hypothetical protein